MAIHHSRLSATTMISLQQQALLTNHRADVACMAWWCHMLMMATSTGNGAGRRSRAGVSAATAKYSPDLMASHGSGRLKVYFPHVEKLCSNSDFAPQENFPTLTE
jgi:hypothetical protein